MKNFKMQKKPKGQNCHAMRCKNEAELFAGSGLLLCGDHWEATTPQERDAMGEVRNRAGAVVSPQREDLETKPSDQSEQSEQSDQKTVVIPEAEALSIVIPEKDSATEMTMQLSELEICDQEVFEGAGEILTSVKSRYKELDAKRKSLTAHLHKAKKGIDDLFKPALTSLKECEGLLKRKMLDYAEQQEREREELMKNEQYSEAIQVGQAELPTNISTRRRWVYEVMDIEKVPVQFLQVNDAKVKGMIADLGGNNVDIPGIRIYSEKNLAVKS